MKSSKLFLGVTATLLGVAAFAASKAKWAATSVFYSKASSCFPDPTLRQVTSTKIGAQLLTVQSGTHKVFITSTCNEPAYGSTAH